MIVYRWVQVSISCLLLLVSPALVFTKSLSYPDVKSTMDKMFSYHVEVKNFSPLIAKRSFKVYLELFDGDKLYLLSSEANQFVEVSPTELKRVVKDYSLQKFDSYQKRAKIIQRAIARHKKIREELRNEIVDETNFHGDEDRVYSEYATSEIELKRRLRKKLHKIYSVREKRANQSLSSEKKTKIFALIEKKFRRHEAIHDNFDDKGNPLSEDKIIHNQSLIVLKAMSKSLDAHSAYYDEDEASELRTMLKKQFHGIGVVLREGEEGIYVSDMVTGGPAQKSKFLAVGDAILEINGENISKASFDEILDLLKGKEGSEVSLKVKQKNGHEKDVTLSREKIVLNQERLTFTAEPCGDGYIGKVVLPGFYDNGEGINAEKDLREAINSLKAMGPLYGLVIDLRENSGGFLTQAVKIAGLFITKGVVVISKYADDEIRYMRDMDGKLYYQGPLILLTSKASASASEIVAQALQDYGVALVVGDERTYGKGSMQYQTITEESSHSFFKVTVGRYYTISGRSTQIEGVIADIVVPTKYSPFNIGERYLEFPLSSDKLDLKKAYEDQSFKDYNGFSKRYMPFLYRKDPRWVGMLEQLKENSRIRLAKDPNFQCFLKKIHGEEKKHSMKPSKKKSARENDQGLEDLQMKESVLILRDMIYIDTKTQ